MLGIDFIVPEAEVAAMILSFAAGEVSEENLGRWIRDNWPETQSAIFLAGRTAPKS